MVIPAYNEGGRIASLVAEWSAELERLQIDYDLAVYDDGSTDGTPLVLAALGRQYPRLRVARHANRGHGPTILRGYHDATGSWVLQVDGDGEIAASAFEALWRRRAEYDLLIACRQGRRATLLRALMTAGARWAVRLLFGARVYDVNSPCRLIRREALRRLLPHVPPSAFAPNVILVGLAARARLRIG